MKKLEAAQNNGKDVNYRQSVLAMGLTDSFCGKIKHGEYVPTKERLEQLSEYLGIKPESFNAYVKRFAMEQIEDHDIFETFRVLATLNHPKQTMLKKAIKNYAVEVQAAVVSKT